MLIQQQAVAVVSRSNQRIALSLLRPALLRSGQLCSVRGEENITRHVFGITKNILLPKITEQWDEIQTPKNAIRFIKCQQRMPYICRDNERVQRYNRSATEIRLCVRNRNGAE